MSFYNRLSYSFGNEDWLTEQKALQIKPGNRVLCITASGDRPLHLLLDDVHEVVSVDANPVQNHLLNLKKEAIRALRDDEYLSFLGIINSSDRLVTFHQIVKRMDKEAAQFWLENKHLIKKGVIYQGAIEKLLRHVSVLICLLRNSEIKQLFEIANIEEQREFLRNRWNNTFWKNSFKYGLNRWISRLVIKDPGLYANVDPNFKPGLYLYERMMASLNHTLAQENALISLILKGNVGKNALPPYLTEKGIDVIRSRIDRLKTQTNNVISFLESAPEASFDRFSLSDVASYMDQATFLRLLKALFRAAKPQARFCMRQFMSRYKIPEGLKPYFQTEPELESQLEREDRAFVYHFTVGKIKK